ncbi:glycosyltransferase [Myxococcota bacterium]|nr:glycosyltransferase [Myxococcota bacterium]
MSDVLQRTGSIGSRGGRPIRILLTISDLRGGGAEREFSLLVQHLSRKRFEPHLCFWRENFAYSVPPDLPVHWVEKTKPWHVPKTVLGLRRLVDELKPDIVFSQLHYVNMLTGTALALTRHRPRWVFRLVNDPKREMQGPFAIWARRALRGADVAVGCCDGVSAAMLEHLRLSKERVATLRNVVDLEAIDRASREPLPIERPENVFIVVHAGRFAPQKNQAMLLKAFAKLKGQRAMLWMLGEGPGEGELRSLADSLEISPQVKWLGFQDNPYTFYRAADCFALSSDHEGLPNAVIEAMACGTPAVSTRCPYGPDELIEDGVSGLLTPVGDVGSFGEALAALLNAPGRVREMGELARRRTLRDFDTREMCGRYEDLFEEVVSR